MISEVKCMDNLEFMSQFPDKFFDLAIVDPPFFKGVATAGFYGKGLSGSGRKRGQYKEIANWDSNIPGQDYYELLLSKSKHQIIWGINYFPDFTKVPAGRLVWDKKNDDSTFSDGEIASCSLIDSVRFFRWKWCGFLQEDAKNKEIRIHPTQKPISLYRWQLREFAKAGDKILDTHLGSQSSRIAAHIEGFDFWGCELDPEYFEAGCKRFNQHIQQQVLF